MRDVHDQSLSGEEESSILSSPKLLAQKGRSRADTQRVDGEHIFVAKSIQKYAAGHTLSCVDKNGRVFLSAFFRPIAARSRFVRDALLRLL